MNNSLGRPQELLGVFPKNPREGYSDRFKKCVRPRISMSMKENPKLLKESNNTARVMV